MSRHEPTRSVASAPSRDGLVVLLVSSLVLATNLGGPPLYDEDEPRNASCSLAMIDRCDWVVPTFHGELRVHKPPLVNWLQIAGYAMFGRNETGARVASTVLTAGSCLLAWRIGCLLFGVDVGRWAGLVMAASIWTAVGGRAATPDAPLVFFTTLSLWMFARGTVGSRCPQTLSRTRAAVIGTALGFAVLAKGPVGLLLPIAAFTVFLVWDGPRRGWPSIWTASRLRPVTVITAAAATCLPWYVWVGTRTDWEWPRRFLLEHNVERFTSALEGHSGGVLYYPAMLLVGLFPWSIASVVAIGHVTANLGSTTPPSVRSAMRLLVAWTATWVGFFSVSATKLPGYVWPAYPALAVLLAHFWITWRARNGTAESLMPLAWVSLVAVGSLMAVGGPLLVSSLLPERSIPAAAWLTLTGVITVVAGIVTWLQQRRPGRFGRCGVPATLAATGVAVTVLLAGTAADRAASPLGPRNVVYGLPPDAAISVSDDVAASTVFYATAARGTAAVGRVDDADDALRHLHGSTDSYLLADRSLATSITDRLPDSHAVLSVHPGLPGSRELVVIGPRIRVDFSRAIQVARTERQ